MSPSATLTLASNPSFVCTVTPATPPQSPSKSSFHNPTPPASPNHQTSFNHSPQYLSPPPGRPGGPKLTLDTSQERLQKYTVVNHDGQSYLKLFSPVLVESPVSFLSDKQLFDDRKLWENGPDDVLQKKIDMEKRETFKVRSRQQLRGFILGIWLGCLMGLLILQQTAAKVYIPSHLARHDTSPLVLFMVILSCAAAVRSGTRCLMTAIATCAAVLTCFATLIANHQSRHAVRFRVYRSVQASSYYSLVNTQ
ncbi:MAG: hypothetical protein J3Q66DRAFT_355952 [Benniella sp.]|nr:MAG: hypothetical protein J3Q66DRAFT_355952 [Benniella sp.]